MWCTSNNEWHLNKLKNSGSNILFTIRCFLRCTSFWNGDKLSNLKWLVQLFIQLRQLRSQDSKKWWNAQTVYSHFEYEFELQMTLYARGKTFLAISTKGSPPDYIKQSLEMTYKKKEKKAGKQRKKLKVWLFVVKSSLLHLKPSVNVR